MQKLFSSLGIKIVFVALYVVSNVWAAFAIIDRNELIADHAGWPSPKPDQIYISLGLVLLVYIGLLFVLKNKILLASKYDEVLSSKALSLTMLALQSIFFAFVLVYSAGSAGGDLEKAGGAGRFLFYVVNPDMLFLIYYAATMFTAEKTRFRNHNLALFLLSNFVRGWLGQILVIMFIYAIAWGEKSGRNLTPRKFFKLASFSLIFFVAASFLMHIKLAMRVGADAVIALLPNLDFLDVLSSFFEVLFSRLQMLSTVLFQVTKQDQLARFIEDGTVGSFYTDGLPQQMVYKILDVFPGENLNLFLWKNYIPGDFFEAQTTVQPGLVGWLYILPYYSVFLFAAYIAILVVINLKMIRYIGGPGLRHLSWFSMLLFLIPGWLGAYISYLWSIAIFIAIIFVIRGTFGKKN